MTDLELIRDYLENFNEKSFECLLGRYLELSKNIVRKMCGSSLDIDDLVQKSWIKTIQSLSSYNDQQKFAAFITTITKNTVKDHWRYSNVRAQTDFFTDLDTDDVAFEAVDKKTDVADRIDTEQQLDNLLKEYIPNLPDDLRLVFLMKHEAEYWDDKQRLDWQTLGVLTKQTEDEVWKRFDLVRKAYKSVYDDLGHKKDLDLGAKDIEVFLLWTQAQRPISMKKVTEKELSLLVGIPLNTFKTRYRAATKRLQILLSTDKYDEELSA